MPWPLKVFLLMCLSIKSMKGMNLASSGHTSPGITHDPWYALRYLLLYFTSSAFHSNCVPFIIYLYGIADIVKVYLFSLNGLSSYVQYSAYHFSLLAVKLIRVILETDSWKLF